MALLPCSAKRALDPVHDCRRAARTAPLLHRARRVRRDVAALLLHLTCVSPVRRHCQYPRDPDARALHRPQALDCHDASACAGLRASWQPPHLPPHTCARGSTQPIATCDTGSSSAGYARAWRGGRTVVAVKVQVQNATRVARCPTLHSRSTRGPADLHTRFTSLVALTVCLRSGTATPNTGPRCRRLSLVCCQWRHTHPKVQGLHYLSKHAAHLIHASELTGHCRSKQ